MENNKRIETRTHNKAEEETVCFLLLSIQREWSFLLLVGLDPPDLLQAKERDKKRKRKHELVKSPSEQWPER